MKAQSISSKVTELALGKLKAPQKIVQIYAPATSYPEDDINSFYNGMDDTLRKPNHYTTAMGDFDAQVENITKPMEQAADKFGLEIRNERGDT